MRPSTIWYILKQGVKNIWRNWMFSAASVLTMAACIFLFGLFYLIVINVNFNTQKAQEKVPITVFFEPGTTQEEMDWVGEQIRARPDVETITFESADEGWEKFAKQYFPEGSAAADVFRDDNPLTGSDNYQVSVNDISLQYDLVRYIEELPHVREVKQAERAAEFLTNISNMVYYVSLIVIGVLLLISIFLISNTVSVGISVRSEEIAIMKYIGATDHFVRAPFVLEGIILGVVGASIPLVSLYYLYQEVVKWMMNNYSSFTGAVSFLSVEQAYKTFLPVGLLLGVGIGLLSSFFTTKKHLRV